MVFKVKTLCVTYDEKNHTNSKTKYEPDSRISYYAGSHRQQYEL